MQVGHLLADERAVGPDAEQLELRVAGLVIVSTLRSSIAWNPGLPSKRCCGPSPTPNGLTVAFMKTFSVSDSGRVPAGTPSTFHGIFERR